MARRSNILIVPLLVMVGVLIGAILLTPGADTPPVPSDGAAAAGAASGEPRPAAIEGGAAVVDADPARRAAIDAGSAGAAAVARIVIRGRLVDAGGAPQAAVALAFRPAAQLGDDLAERFPLAELAAEGGEQTVELVTDADGRFEIRSDAGRGGSLVLPRDANRLFAASGRRLAIEARDADHDLGDLTVITAVSVRGRVVDDGGRPIATAQVRANRRGEAGFALWRSGEGVAVDAEGRFELRGLAAGELEVRAASRDFVPTAVFVTAADGATVEGVEIRMPRGASVAGTVADDRGAPIVGAKVVAFRDLSTAPGVEVRQIDASEAVETDAGGYFQLSGLLGERVALRVWCDGHEATQRTDVAIGTQNLDLRLRRLGSIAGRVLSGADRSVPMAGSTVTATRSAQRGPGAQAFVRPVAAVTDAEGRYVLEGVPPGAVRVVAAGGAHLESRPQEVELLAGQRLDYVDLYVETGAVVEAQVFGPDRQPIAGAKVVVLAAPETAAEAPAGAVSVRSVRFQAGPAELIGFDGPRVLGEATTDESGVARVEFLPPGRAVLRASHPDHAPSTDENVTLLRNRSTEWVATLRAAGFVDLTALDADGSPLPSTPWVLKPQAGGEPVRGETDANGTARVGPLLPGAWTALLVLPPQVTDLGGGGVSFVMGGSNGEELEQTAKPVQVTAGGTVPVTLQRPVLTRLHGRVTDASGPVADAAVRLRRDGELPFGGQSTRSDAEGRYSLTSVLPGTYELEWSRPRALLPHRTSLDVQPGIPEIEFDLQVGGGQIRVTVVDADGRPLGDAEVRLARAAAPGQPARRAVSMIAMAIGDGPGGESTTRMTIGEDPRVKTGADGVAILDDVPPGTFRITAEREGHVEAVRNDVVVVDRQLTDAGTLTLAPAGVVTGALTEWPEGVLADVALVEVRAVGADGPARRETVQGREYRIDGLAAGEYELRARPLLGEGEAFGPARRIQVAPGATAELDLPLR